MDRELPLRDYTVIQGGNVPSSISGTLRPDLYNLRDPDTGVPVLRKYHARIIAENDELATDPIVCIIDSVMPGTDGISVTAGGPAMYPVDQPWLGEDYEGVDQDPMDMLRKIWDHLQSQPDGDIDVVVDNLSTPIRVGTEPEDVNFTTDAGEEVSFVAGPFRLARWATDDLGNTINSLLEETPLQYREQSRWIDDDTVETKLEFGYPTLGIRRHDITFEIGVNVTSPPEPVETEYATEILQTGAGEGVKRTAVHLTRFSRGIRRAVARADTSIDSNVQATRAARPVLSKLTGEPTVDTLELVNHEWAIFGTFDPLDEVRLIGSTTWRDFDTWVRIREIEYNTTGKAIIRVEEV